MAIEVTSEPTQVAEVVVSEERQEISKDTKDDTAAAEDVKVEELSGELTKNDESETGEFVEEKKIGGEASSSAVIVRSGTFKEESNLLSDLKEYEKKALIELRSLLENAILGNALFKATKDNIEEPEKIKSLEKQAEENDERISEGEGAEKQSEEGKEKESSSVKEGKEKEMPANETEEVPKHEGKEKEKSTKKEGTEEEKPTNKEEEEEGEKRGKPDDEENGKISECNANENNPEGIEERRVEVDKDITLWGVPLLPSKGDTGTDIVLLKFLRAPEFQVSEAFEMLRNILQRRKEFKMDSILDEDFGDDMNAAAYMSGVDHEDHPVCYSVYGVFENDEIYNRAFGSEDSREKFLRWRSQLMEKGIQKLDFKPAGVSSLVQINDLKNTPGPARKELRMATKLAVGILQDNYPELVARNIFINVPFCYYAFNALLSPFLTQRTKSKFVFARPARVTETLLRYIAVEEIPVHYGGFKRENDSEFSLEDKVLEVNVKAGSTETIDIPAPEVIYYISHCYFVF